jgi:hypothetical protein
VGLRELVADQRVGDLPRRMWSTDVGIAIVDRHDAAVQRSLQRLAGALGLRQLGHLDTQFKRWSISSASPDHGPERMRMPRRG